MKRSLFLSRYLVKLALVCQASFLLISVALGANSETIKNGFPWFNINLWQDQNTGMQIAPYNLQSRMYQIKIETKEKVDAEDKVSAKISVFDNKGQLLVGPSDISIKTRGSTSADFPKKQYSLEFNSSDNEMSLLNMAPASKFVLSAPYLDKSLLRNVLAYNAANLMGNYAPKTRVVNLSLKAGSGGWKDLGVHVLTEKPDLGPGKVDIDLESGHSSAFFLSIDRVKDGDFTVKTKEGLAVIVNYPSKKDISSSQADGLKNQLNEIEKSLSSSNSKKFEDLGQLIDFKSAVDFFIVQEMTRNEDAYVYSSHMYIPAEAGSKLFFGPVWDFNIAYGNNGYDDDDGFRTEGWRFAERGNWFDKIFKHPEFCSKLKSRWSAFRSKGILSNRTLFSIVDSHIAIMGDSVAENFKIWKIFSKNEKDKIDGEPYWGLQNYDQQISVLKSWIALRNNWMDREIDKLNCD